MGPNLIIDKPILVNFCRERVAKSLQPGSTGKLPIFLPCTFRRFLSARARAANTFAARTSNSAATAGCASFRVPLVPRNNGAWQWQAGIGIRSGLQSGSTPPPFAATHETSEISLDLQLAPLHWRSAHCSRRASPETAMQQSNEDSSFCPQHRQRSSPEKRRSSASRLMSWTRRRRKRADRSAASHRYMRKNPDLRMSLKSARYGPRGRLAQRLQK